MPKLKRVYVAGPWIKGGDANRLAKYLKSKGYSITSRWLGRIKKNLDPNYDYSKDRGFSEDEGRNQALADIADIQDSQVVVVLNSAKSEGKVVEQGIALAMRKPIVVLGRRTNVFQYLGPPRVHIAKTKKQVLKILKGLNK